jgi:hypothetical protein
MIKLFTLLMKLLSTILWFLSTIPMVIAVILLGRGRIIDNCLKDMIIEIWYGE